MNSTNDAMVDAAKKWATTKYIDHPAANDSTSDCLFVRPSGNPLTEKGMKAMWGADNADTSEDPPQLIKVEKADGNGVDVSSYVSDTIFFKNTQLTIKYSSATSS